MPLYRHSNRLIFFAHVPKCAGTSVTEYLHARFGDAGFEDRAFIRDPAEFPWTKTSPQHVTVSALERILPANFIDYSFAVVRHPADRLASVYRFQKSSQKTIGRFVPFGFWLSRLANQLAKNPYRYDAHALPQVKFVPDDAEVFRLEDGLDMMVARLDAEFGEHGKSIGIGHEKKSSKSTKLTRKNRELIRSMYAADYERFGYET